jgi:hypothetical protein
MATDAAGNTAASELHYSWTLTLPQFAQITGSPASALSSASAHTPFWPLTSTLIYPHL